MARWPASAKMRTGHSSGVDSGGFALSTLCGAVHRIGRNESTAADRAVSNGRPYLARGAQIDQVAAKSRDHWRQLAIDDLRVCARQCLGKAELRLDGGLTNASLVNSGILVRTAAEASKASDKERCEQRRPQAPRRVGSTRLEATSRPDACATAQGLGIAGSFRHSQRFLLPYPQSNRRIPPGRWCIGLWSLLAAICFGGMSRQGLFVSNVSKYRLVSVNQFTRISVA